MGNATRWAITVVPTKGDFSGQKILATPNQGERYFFDTPEECQKACNEIRNANSPETLGSIWGQGAAESIMPHEVEVWPTGDAKATIF